MKMSSIRKAGFLPVVLLGLGLLIGGIMVRSFSKTLFLKTLQESDALKNAVFVVGAKYEGAKGEFLGLNIEKRIHPGSNFKLFTAAASFASLGPNFTFSTKLYRHGADLVIVGSGDPTFQGKDFAEFVEALRPHGKVKGKILYDDRIFVGEKFGPGWAYDWQKEYFSVPITGLQINDNLLSIRGGKNDQGVFEITTTPLEQYPLLDAMTYHEDPDNLKIPITATMKEDGVIALMGDSMRGLPFHTSSTVKDPSLVAALAFKQELKKAGLLKDDPKVQALTGDLPLGDLVYEHRSKPLHEIIFTMLKFSKNNYAETLVRTLGLHEKNEGSQKKGVEVLHEFFDEIGIPEEEMGVFDGSGLSPQTRVTASALLLLFEYVNTQPWQELFWKALPESQVDGTLKHRFENAGLEHTVIGKTGTHEFSSSLSGKIIRPGQKNILFSVHVFNHPFSTEESVKQIIPLIDKTVAFIGKQF